MLRGSLDYNLPFVMDDIAAKICRRGGAMGIDELQRVKSEIVQMKRRETKSRCSAMGFYCFPGSKENESFNQGASVSSKSAEGCTEFSFSPKETQMHRDYEDLIYLLGGETRWLHIESQD